MQTVGVAPLLLKLIEDLHSGTKARIRLGKHMSASFFTNSGVRQGCILAPALFCRAIDWIMEHLSIEFGIRLGPNHLTDPDYADDIVALGTSPNQLADFLSNFQQSAEKLGLKLNRPKLKYRPSEQVVQLQT